MFKFIKNNFNVPTIILVIAIIIGLLHLFSYLYPFTDNAFVVANTQPVAADVSGYITDIYVKNGQRVNKGDVLFKVFESPYQYAYQSAKAAYTQANLDVGVIQVQTIKTRSLLEAAKDRLNKAKYEYMLKSNKALKLSVSTLEIRKLAYDINTLTNEVKALNNQISIEDSQIKSIQQKAKIWQSNMDNAKLNIELTNVRAGFDGVVDNMFLSVGAPVIIHQPLFSLIDTNAWYVQANMDETDLLNVRPGDKAIIVLRMYYFGKIYHGVVVNNLWVVDRQKTIARTQEQTVANENEWLQLPQRFPLQIKILDPDPNYPLNPGASAYVYIQTK